MLLIAALLLLAAACNSRQGDSGLVKQTLEPTSAEPTAEAPTNMPDLTRAPTPEPTIDPTPEQTPEQTKERPSDEWFIEQAWSVAQRVGEVFGVEFNKESSSVLNSERTPCVFFDASEPTDITGVSIGFLDYKGINDFSVIMFGSSLNFSNKSAAATEREREIVEWRKRWGEQRIVVTPEEIVTAGCTETEGDEYMQTVARLCGEKMAELLTGAPEGFPARCIKAVAAGCEYVDWTYTSGYAVSMAVIPEDPLGFELFFDIDMTLFEDEAYPELWGWCEYGGLLELEREGDNWTAGVYLDREGR